MKTVDDARAASMPATREVAAHLVAGVNRLTMMLEQIRPDDPGAADRCERLAGQFDGLRLQALRLGSALREQTRSAA